MAKLKDFLGRVATGLERQDRTKFRGAIQRIANYCFVAACCNVKISRHITMTKACDSNVRIAFDQDSICCCSRYTWILFYSYGDMRMDCPASCQASRKPWLCNWPRLLLFFDCSVDVCFIHIVTLQPYSWSTDWAGRKSRNCVYW